MNLLSTVFVLAHAQDVSHVHTEVLLAGALLAGFVLVTWVRHQLAKRRGGES